MPDVEENKTVDIDTSGPGADIDIAEEKKEEVVEQPTTEPEVETVVEEQKEEAPQVETKEEPQEKKELEEYSTGVQKRIAKLTKKWREAERQKDEALKYAELVVAEQKTIKNKLSKLEPGFLSATEQSLSLIHR